MDDARRGISDDVREVSWRFVVGAGAGAIVGVVMGGIGGRLAMLMLRVGSSDALHGATTDDGFVIGRISTATFFLLIVTGGLGAASGVVYVVIRRALPSRGSPLLLGVVAALVTGADIVDPGSFDFSALDPKAFAIVAFAVLPGLAAVAIAMVVERLLVVEPWSSRLLGIVLSIAALILNIVLVVVAALAGVALGLRRSPALADRVLSVARLVVPLALVAVAVRSGVELWRDANVLI
jgi:hypothetical protein